MARHQTSCIYIAILMVQEELALLMFLGLTAYDSTTEFVVRRTPDQSLTRKDTLREFFSRERFTWAIYRREKVTNLYLLSLPLLKCLSVSSFSIRFSCLRPDQRSAVVDKFLKCKVEASVCSFAWMQGAQGLMTMNVVPVSNNALTKQAHTQLDRSSGDKF